MCSGNRQFSGAAEGHLRHRLLSLLALSLISIFSFRLCHCKMAVVPSDVGPCSRQKEGTTNVAKLMLLRLFLLQNFPGNRRAIFTSSLHEVCFLN